MTECAGGDLAEALKLHDQGLDVMVGDLDVPDTYRRARIDPALVVATREDTTNTSIADECGPARVAALVGGYQIV